MSNHLFSEDHLAVLQAPQRWSLITSYGTPDVDPVRGVRHRRWTAAHSHVHDYPELDFVLSGSGEHALGGKVYPLTAGAVIIDDGVRPHQWRYPPWSPPSARLSIYLLHDRHLVARMLETGVTRRGYRERWSFIVPLTELKVAEPGELFDIVRAAARAPGARRACCMALASCLAAFVISHGRRTRETAEPDFSGDVIRETEGYIRRALGNGCDLSTLADVAGYSRYHFLRLFRKRTGMRPHEYVNLVRREAVDSMQAAGMRTKAMAEALGFSQSSAFTRWRQRNAAVRSRPDKGAPPSEIIE